MMTEKILDDIAEEQGWNESTKLDLCLQYISNQRDDVTFKDFLQQIANEENEESKL